MSLTIRERVMAFAAGIALVSFLTFIALGISRFAPSAKTIDPIKQVFGATFIGLTTGRYLGQAMKHESRKITYLIVGFFLSLTFITFYYHFSLPGGGSYGIRNFLIPQAEMSPVFLITISGIILILLFEMSGLVDDHPSINILINRLKRLSIFGLIVLGAIQFIFPFIGKLWASTDIIGKIAIIVITVPAIVIGVINIETEYQQTKKENGQGIRRKYHQFSLYIRKV